MRAREAAIKAMHEVTGPVIAIVLMLCAVFVPIAFLGGLTGELYRQFAVDHLDRRRHLGHRRADADAGAVRADPEARAQAAGPLLQLRSTTGSHRVTGRYADGVAWMMRRGGIGAGAVRRHGGARRRPVADHAGLAGARRGPGLLHRGGDPARRRLAASAPTRWSPKSSTAIKSNPNNDDAIAFTGFDFLGGGFRNNAATIFVTQKHWDERTVPAQALVGELFHEDRAHQGGAGAGLQPAADLRPRQRRRLRALHPEPRRRRREAARRGDAASSWARPARAKLLGRRADAVARQRRRSCTSTSIARRPRRSACRSTRCSTRCRRRSAATTSTTSTSPAAPGRC